MADSEAGGLIAGNGGAISRRRRGGGVGGVALLIAALLVMPACELGVDRRAPHVPSSTPGTTSGPVVGLVGTMTGSGAWRGDDAFEGADLGVHALNRTLPEGREPYELVTLDDRGDPTRAVALVERLAAEDSTTGVVYAGPPEALPRAEGALAEAGVPAILCFGDLRGDVSRTPHLYQVSPPAAWQAQHLAGYILKDRDYRTTGLVMERTSSGRSARAAMKRALTALGGRRAEAAGYGPGAGNLPDLLARLRRQKVEALVVVGGPGLVERLGPALRRAGALYRSTRDARIASRADGGRARPWRPQVLLFDLGLTPGVELPPGTVASESYGRGAHYLPVPAFRRWRAAFVDWWDAAPHGWELRAYQAVRMIGWAAVRTQSGGDLARSLEGARGIRFGGMTATFTARDHLLVEPAAMGLWAIPRPDTPVLERGRLPAAMPWVPLARTFTLRAGAARALGDARTLWEQPRDGRLRLRFGVRTPRSDPVH